MKITDQTPMEFGRHKGKRLQDVPAGYLLWWFEQKIGAREPLPRPGSFQAELLDYCRDNLACLEKEQAGEL